VTAPVVVAFDGQAHVLGRPDRGVYVTVPPAGAAFMTVLKETGSVVEATTAASATAGEEVDGLDFLTGLAQAGLLAEAAAGTDPAAPAVPGHPGRDIRWIEGVSRATAQRLFGRVAWTGYGLAAAFAAVVLLARPDLRPKFEHLWFLTDPLLSLIVLIAVGTVLGAIHEAWHWLAGRAVGVPAVFRLSRRGVGLVFETDLTQLVAVRRSRRYSAYLAGMAFDVVVLAILLAARLAYRADALPVPAVLDRFFGGLVLGQVLNLTWQFVAVFARSDMYAVLANALGCHNLYRATVLTTKNRLMRLGQEETAELRAMSAHDRRVASWFGLVFLLGMTVMWFVFVVISLPYLVGMVVWLWTNLSSAHVASLAFWEATALLVYFVATWGLPGVLAWRERRLRRRQLLL
jgi:hypothetical protein